METNPNVPRQRNRRADRQTFQPEAEAIHQGVPAMPVYQQPVTPVQQPAPMQYAMPVQQQIPVQPVAYQQMAAPVQQMPPQPMPQPTRMQPQPRVMAQPRVAVQTQQVQYAPRARVNAQPMVQQPMDVPHARASHGLLRETAKAARTAEREAADKEAAAKAQIEAQERAKWQKKLEELEAEKRRLSREFEAEERANRPRKKLSGWLTTAISLSLIAVMGLIAAYYLMQAYLVQEEEARIAAHQALLNNYHVTEQADGSLRVTWQDEIEKYAAEYNLQPAFVTAIIRNESSFRTNARSSVGARGLMQMMPDTAEWIAGKLKDTNYDYENMWDGETNIRYGCWYLGYLSRLFHGDATLVSAAYHAGQTTVTQWLCDPKKSSDGITLNLNGLAEGPTKQYIGRVTQTYGIYQSLLYPDEPFTAAAAQDAPAPSRSGFGITIER